MSDDEQVKVEQVDREAARSFIAHNPRAQQPTLETALAEAFARHRQQTAAALIEKLRGMKQNGGGHDEAWYDTAIDEAISLLDGEE